MFCTDFCGFLMGSSEKGVLYKGCNFGIRVLKPTVFLVIRDCHSTDVDLALNPKP